jgi:hypothetical protein
MGFAERRESPPALVGSYPTVSPLLALAIGNPTEEASGLLSVALSLTFRPVDVIDHLALRSPDFPLVLCGHPPHQRLPDLPLGRKYIHPIASRPLAQQSEASPIGSHDGV